MPQARNYAIYARKSDEREERQTQSIEDQVKLDRELAERLHLTVVAEFTEAKSAKEPFRISRTGKRVPMRNEFTRLMELIEKGRVDGIICWHPDRLSRNEVDAANITHAIRHSKLVDLQFVNYTFINSPEGIMMLQTALVQSQYYSSKLGTDVRRGMKSKAEKGWYPHRAPEGYMNSAEIVNYVECKKIIPDPERWDAIRRFWELMLSDKYSVPQALDILNNDWGYRTRPSKLIGGKSLSLSSAYDLLHNVFYTGHFISRGINHAGQHPLMVTTEEFVRVQEIVRRETRPRRSERDFAYRGLLRCKNCDCQVTGSLSRGRSRRGSWVYYHCSNAKRTCDRIAITEPILEAKIEGLLRQIHIDPDTEVFALRIIEKWQHSHLQTEASIKRDQTHTIEELKRQLSALLDLKLRAMISDQAFTEKQNALTMDISRLEEQMNSSDDGQSDTAQSATNSVRFLAHAQGRFLVGSNAEKREIARALGVSYTFDRGYVGIDLHPTLYAYRTFKPLENPSESIKKDDPSSCFRLGAHDRI